MITANELEIIRIRLETAKKSEIWGKHGLAMEATKATTGTNAKVWYGDGDLCAEIHDNLGLGIDGDAVAEFFANAVNDVERLLLEIRLFNDRK